jgi:hypothetical protein
VKRPRDIGTAVTGDILLANRVARRQSSSAKGSGDLLRGILRVEECVEHGLHCLVELIAEPWNGVADRNHLCVDVRGWLRGLLWEVGWRGRRDGDGGG